VNLQVSDQGPGIPPDLVESVFELGRRFAEGSTDSSSEQGGGFGLHIVRGIVEAHGGRIWVATDACPGATLCVSLPLTSSRSTAVSDPATHVVG
jgi:signal transduction histidine kinase